MKKELDECMQQIMPHVEKFLYNASGANAVNRVNSITTSLIVTLLCNLLNDVKEDMRARMALCLSRDINDHVIENLLAIYKKPIIKGH